MHSAPPQLVAEILSNLRFENPKDLDVLSVAEHFNVEIRYASLDGCAANIVGVADRAIMTIDERSTPSRQRFSAAHELSHWIYDRDNGVYVCTTNDLNLPWTNTTRVDAIERRANRFAAELLMPRAWFKEAAAGRSMSFDTVEELRTKFRASRTSTGIRLVELGSYLAMLFMFDSSGRRTWYCHSKELPTQFSPTRNISSQSEVWRDIVRERRVRSEIREVDGDIWIDHPQAFNLTLHEQGIRVRDNILIMVWLSDDRLVEEIIESGEGGRH